MGKAEDWQTKITKALDPYFVTVLNPRRDDWDSSWEQTLENKEFRQQVEWEQSAMEQASFIAMYFDPKTQSPITLVEYGQYIDSGKLIVACPKGFWRRGNLEVMCNTANIPLLETLDELIEMTINRLESKFTN
jgi:hypothetical protein